MIELMSKTRWLFRLAGKLNLYVCRTKRKLDIDRFMEELNTMKHLIAEIEADLTNPKV